MGGLTDERGKIIGPGQWVVLTKDSVSDLAPAGSVWRLSAEQGRTARPMASKIFEDGDVWLDALFLPVPASSVRHLDFYSTPDRFYIGDKVLNTLQSPDHPRGFYTITGFRYSDTLYVVTDKDTHGRMPGRYRALPDDVDDDAERHRSLWLAYDQACELVKMHPSPHPLHVEMTSLKHNLMDALLRLIEV